jgi:hypothetical protein
VAHDPATVEARSGVSRFDSVVGAAVAVEWEFETLWVRVACALVLGFVIFRGTVLLHEVVHKAAVDGDRPALRKNSGIPEDFPCPTRQILHDE